MTYYAHNVDVSSLAGVYDTTHAELLRRTGGHVDGLTVHRVAAFAVRGLVIPASDLAT